MEKQNIVVIGGGTGTHTVLSGLKRYPKRLNLTAIVTMADSGGSTGRLRDEFGFLPVGDVRMALAALARDTADHEELLRKLFLYRFNKGDGLSGHNFGNLLLVALTDILGSEEAAIRAAAKVLRVAGHVLPVTNEHIDLVAEYADGTQVIGEHDIDEPTTFTSNTPIINLSVTPSATITDRAEAALLAADMIVLGPGDLYTSVLANVVVDGVAAAIKNSGATVVYVCNLMTKSGQTLGMGVTEHVAEIERYIGTALDAVLVNTGAFPPELLARYKADGEFPVKNNFTSDTTNCVTADFLATEAVTTAEGDILKRSLIRHDPRTLAREIVSLLPTK
ncbi:YvcK family protein [Candidatus Kaiserbacteria bacterium]|nr:YvcK family protein [Candidatus Kaiserbacteria bacterium]